MGVQLDHKGKNRTIMDSRYEYKKSTRKGAKKLII